MRMVYIYYNEEEEGGAVGDIEAQTTSRDIHYINKINLDENHGGQG